MKTVSVREMRQVLSGLEDLLEEVGELVITRRGRAIARLVPLTPGRRPPSRRRLREEMPALSEGSEMLVREDRDKR